MKRFNTTRFGTLEVSEDSIITFPEGIPGFPDAINYILIDYKDTPFKWLQAVDDPDLAFIVTEPKTFSIEYSIKIDETIRDRLMLENEEDLAVLLIVRVENGNVIANLNGPLLINAGNKTGLQAVLDKV